MEPRVTVRLPEGARGGAEAPERRQARDVALRGEAAARSQACGRGQRPSLQRGCLWGEGLTWDPGQVPLVRL